MHWTLSDMILDLAHNSIEAGADLVELHIDEHGPSIQIEIVDNGKGMDREQQAQALDPFYTEPGKHPGRRIGLGLPFLVQTVDQTGGRYALESSAGHGTRLMVQIDSGNVDCPPLGDLAQAAAVLMCFDGEYELLLRRSRAGKADETAPRVYEISRSQLRDVLGDLSYASSRILLAQYLRECEYEIESME